MSIIALQKAATLKSGAVATFWRVVGASYSETDPTSLVYIAGYIDREKFDNGAEPLVVQAAELQKEQVAHIRLTRELPTKALLYSILLSMPLFKDAIPVLSETPAKV